MNKEELTTFLNNAYVSLNNGFTGCIYKEVEEGLFVVASIDENNEPVAKLAYNCDDMQCDYDTDWYAPEYKDGFVADIETNLLKDNSSIAKYLLKMANEIIEELNAGNIKDWR